MRFVEVIDSANLLRIRRERDRDIAQRQAADLGAVDQHLGREGREL
jgi:hypothetical protein